MAVSPAAKHETEIDWWHLAEGSLAFLTVEHTFRYATEWGTRDAFDTPFWPGYLASVGNLHGWADGDPFLVNYVGHPMQGAVAGFIWQHSDRAYRDVVFGENRRYWKAKLRGAAFSYLYSVQFEIGLLSEASIGHVQEQFPQQGFVDHVITPTVGLGWTLAEDSLDRYVITLLEEHNRNPYVRLLVRSGLNPSRSMANVMNGMVPWHRDNRPGVFKPFPEAAVAKAALERETAKTAVDPPPGVAPFEFTVTPNFRTYLGSGAKGSCVGGGSSIAFRVASQWQIVADVNGCKLLDLPTNLSGDSLNYMIGPRWTPRPEAAGTRTRRSWWAEPNSPRRGFTRTRSSRFSGRRGRRPETSTLLTPCTPRIGRPTGSPSPLQPEWTTRSITHWLSVWLAWSIHIPGRKI